MILSRTLRKIGFEVCEAPNGKEALETLQADSSLSLVLVDWNMPEVNGLEVLRQIRRSPVLRSLVVIMVTTETEMEQMVAALAAGANEYVMKPFTEQILLEKLELLGVHP